MDLRSLFHGDDSTMGGDSESEKSTAPVKVIELPDARAVIFNDMHKLSRETLHILELNGFRSEQLLGKSIGTLVDHFTLVKNNHQEYRDVINKIIHAFQSYGTLETMREVNEPTVVEVKGETKRVMNYLTLLDTVDVMTSLREMES
jgi:hypothetical protein